MTTRADIVKAARSYLGVRFRHQGRNRLGVDCAGLVVLTFADCGIPVRDEFGYGKYPDTAHLRATLAEQLTPAVGMQAGDVVLMRFDRDAQHLGIVTDHPNGLGIIHAYAGARKVVEHRIDKQWADRIVAVYSHPEVA